MFGGVRFLTDGSQLATGVHVWKDPKIFARSKDPFFSFIFSTQFHKSKSCTPSTQHADITRQWPLIFRIRCEFWMCVSICIGCIILKCFAWCWFGLVCHKISCAEIHVPCRWSITDRPLQMRDRAVSVDWTSTAPPEAMPFWLQMMFDDDWVPFLDGGDNAGGCASLILDDDGDVEQGLLLEC